MSNYSRLYIAALSLIAFLVLVTHFLMDNAISSQSHDASVINISGRQRMLSQRMALITAQLIYPNKREWARAELLKAADEMETAHKGLTHGSTELNLPTAHSDTINSMYFDSYIEPIDQEYVKKYGEYMSLDELVLHYIHEVREVLELPDHDLVHDNDLLSHTINDYHNVILPYLHNIVAQYEKESLQHVRELQAIENKITIATLLLLLMECIFIFRPMVSQIKKTTQRLEEANKDLAHKRHQEKLASLGHLSSTLVHEINNYLQPILGLSSILKVKIQDPSLQKHIGIVEKNALQARAVMRSVLNFSRMTDAKMMRTPSQDLFHDVFDFSQSLCPSSVTLTQSERFKNEIDGYTLCDPTSVTQVFVNIVKNASHSMNEQGVIECDIEQRQLTTEECERHSLPMGKYSIISIKDSGTGMDEDTRAALFEPYFTTKNGDDGTGLGLSTALNIMKQHQGSIGVETAVNLGTTIFLYFPYLQNKEDCQEI